MLWTLAADAVLFLHVCIVVFVVLGLVLIVLGNLRGWRFANAWWFRLTHLATIGVVVAQSWLGMVCPLTTLELWLRARAGEATYAGGFIEHWLSRLLYFQAPPWVFVLAYTGFGLCVLAAWWRWPPRARDWGFGIWDLGFGIRGRRASSFASVLLSAPKPLGEGVS